MKRFLVGLVAALYVAACFLPSEPSGAERIEFQLDFALPYRVPLAGAAQPAIQITAGGEALSNARYRLESLDEDVLRVDATERGLEGVARGTASVRVIYLTATGAPDTVFPVHVVVSRIAVGPSATSITTLGATTQLSATAYDAKDSIVPNVAFTWSSANPAVATVNDAGLVRSTDEGTVAITAEADGVTGSSEVSVTQVAAAVRVAPELDTLRTVGRSIQFIALAFDSTSRIISTAKPAWTTSDAGVARVNTAGLVTATGAGTARIIARVGEAADTGMLVVAQVIRRLEVTPGYDTLTAIADTARLVALALDSLNFPIPNPSVGWATSDAAVATVDQTGLVQAAKNGVVLVTASAAGQSASATVLVRQEVVAARIAEDNVTVTGAGATVRLSGAGIDRNGFVVPDAPLTWRSSSQCVARVDASGLVTAHGDGETTITASTRATTMVLPSGTATVTVTGAGLGPVEFAYVERDAIYGNCGGSSQWEGPEFSRVLIPNTSAYGVGGPAWSPDGASLAFVRFDYGAGCARIYIARADGSDARPVTDGCDHAPAWSPEGTRIAFVRQSPPNASAIYIANADGSNVRKLWGDNYAWSSPTWSPDGTRLAFARAWASESVDDAIALVNADGTGFSVLFHGEGYSRPAWSPDGSQLALSRDYYDVLLVNLDGSGVTVLARGGPAEPYFCVEYGAPAWSPIGTHIVYAFRRYGSDYDFGGQCNAGVFSWGLAVIDRAGTELRQVPTAFVQDPAPHSPTWRRLPPLTSPAVPAAARPPRRWEP